MIPPTRNPVSLKKSRQEIILLEIISNLTVQWLSDMNVYIYRFVAIGQVVAVAT